MVSNPKQKPTPYEIKQTFWAIYIIHNYYLDIHKYRLFIISGICTCHMHHTITNYMVLKFILLKILKRPPPFHCFGVSSLPLQKSSSSLNTINQSFLMGCSRGV